MFPVLTCAESVAAKSNAARATREFFLRLGTIASPYEMTILLLEDQFQEAQRRKKRILSRLQDPGWDAGLSDSGW
jgi:hypothetical protein